MRVVLERVQAAEEMMAVAETLEASQNLSKQIIVFNSGKQLHVSNLEGAQDLPAILS